MSTFKAALRVVAAHPLYLTIYALVISLMGAFIVLASSASASSEPAEYEPYAADVAIVDRDGSPLSHAFAQHMGDLYTLVDVADDPRELQDAIATGRADCVFVVPEGFGDELIRAARAGDDLPQIEEAYGVSTQASALSGVEAARFSTLAGSAAALDGGAGLEEVATMALSAAAERADVEVRAAPSSGGVAADGVELYLQFGSYAITSSVIVCVGLVFSAMSRPEVERRLGAGPQSLAARDAAVFASCLVLTLAACALSSLVGVVALRDYIAALPASHVVLAFVANFAFGLVPLSIAYFCTSFGAREEVLNAVGNIFGMVMSFLGGAWIPLSFMGAGVAAAAHFAPTFWTNQAIAAVLGAEALTPAVMGSYFTSVGITLLFAVAIAAVGLSVARGRRA